MMSDADNARDKKVQRIIVIEGLVNLVVLLIKLGVGLTTGSLAILGDAIHSLTDVLNNIIAFFIIRLSSLPPDRKHPYGHRKFETVAVFGLATLLTVVAFELALRAFSKDNSEVDSTPLGLGIMIGVLLINISLATWQRSWAKKLKSEILLADASHTFGDVLTTIVVIVGWQLSAMGYAWLDKVTALGVSGLIFYLAYGLFQKAIPVLVDEIAIEPELLIDAVKKIRGVEKVQRVRSRWIGSSKAADVTIIVDASLSIKDSHGIANEVESLLEEKFGINDCTVHIET